MTISETRENKGRIMYAPLQREKLRDAKME